MSHRYTEQINQFVKFFSVGMVSTAVHYVFMIFAVEMLIAPPIVASSSGYIIGAMVSYALNYKFTFNSNRPHADAGIRFMFGTLLGFLVNAAIVAIGINLLGANYLLTQFISTGFVFFINFIIGKFWTFKRI